ncbi:Uncharacterised protein [Klebsiella michiganensis]|nr:Uncharacterised protein [Klebsiella michiganensis]
MPLVKMTKVMPAARIALTEIERAIFSRLSTRLKFGAKVDIRISSTSRTIKIPTPIPPFRKIKRRFDRQFRHRFIVVHGILRIDW